MIKVLGKRPGAEREGVKIKERMGREEVIE